MLYCSLEAKASLQVVHVLLDFKVEVPSVCLEPFRTLVSPSVYSHVGEYWVLYKRLCLDLSFGQP